MIAYATPLYGPIAEICRGAVVVPFTLLLRADGHLNLKAKASVILFPRTIACGYMRGQHEIFVNVVCCDSERLEVMVKVKTPHHEGADTEKVVRKEELD